MAASTPEHAPRRCAVLATIAALLVAPSLALAQAQRPGSSEAVTLDAASSEVDYRSSTVLFRDVIITQGGVRVAAGRARATGLDFDDATWTFGEDVRIDIPGGALRSSEATVTFARNRVARAVIRGNPATFEQKLEGARGTARGRAGSIEYDLVKGTVRLSEDAWLSDGRSEIRGQSLVYDLAAQRVEAGAAAATGTRERVQITIRPGTPTAPGSPQAAPPAAPPPAEPAPRR